MKSTLILFAFVFAFNACSQKNTAPASEATVVEEKNQEVRTEKKSDVNLQKKELDGAQIKQSVKTNIDVSKLSNQLKKVDTTQQTPEPKKP